MKRSFAYILDGKKPVPCSDLRQAEELMRASEERLVARDLIGSVLISTTFLVIDHGAFGPPVLFETMIFGGKHSGYQQRYETWEEAERGHARAKAKVLEKEE